MQISIMPLILAEEEDIQNLIRTAMLHYTEGTVAAATLRRLEKLFSIYSLPGSTMLIAKDGTKLVGAAGVGPLHGLSTSEGIAELRDIVVEVSYRKLGIGAQLIDGCIQFAKSEGYRTLYLETTPTMSGAQRLFQRKGFRPVLGKRKDGSMIIEDVPGYYILENL